MTAVAITRMTAEQFARLTDNGRSELVRGRIVPLNMPYPRHGQICSKVDRLVGGYAEQHELGHVVTNDSGVITEHDPDTVRGADVAFYSYAKVPKGPLPQGYLNVVPDLVFEVRSPGDAWSAILAKVAEYLGCGVRYVAVLDQMTETIRLYTSEEPEHILERDDELTLPDLLGEFRVRVGAFFA